MKRKSVITLIAFLIIAIDLSIVFFIRKSRGFPQSIQVETYKTLGHPEAPLFLVLFSDFNCPYCSDLREPLHQLLKKYPQYLKIYFKHFPLRSHPNSHLAAQGAECAADQGKFWEFHELLFANAVSWQNKDKSEFSNILVDYAVSIGLDYPTFQQCLNSGKKIEIVDANIKEGHSYFIQATPTMILNGRKIVSRRNMETEIKKAIEKLDQHEN